LLITFDDGVAAARKRCTSRHDEGFSLVRTLFKFILYRNGSFRRGQYTQQCESAKSSRGWRSHLLCDVTLGGGLERSI
jgi:hypothetical protein